jgi:uncharacterized membrane protein YfcA
MNKRMDLQNIIGLILIGAVAGILSGLLGLGDAIIIIPSLVMILGYSQDMAEGTTLMMMVPPVGALAAYHFYSVGKADVKTALILGSSFFICAYFGARLTSYIPQEILKKTFAALLVLIAIKMWLQK